MNFHYLAELKISQKFSNKNNSDYPIFMNIFEIFEITFFSNLSYWNLMITFMEHLEFRPNVHWKDAPRFHQIICFVIKNPLIYQCNLRLNELTKSHTRDHLTISGDNRSRIKHNISVINMSRLVTNQHKNVINILVWRHKLKVVTII